MPTKITYSWLHIPSGARGSRTIEATERTLHDLINRWNAQAPGLWQYWTAPQAWQYGA